jgi:hypothetical protein
MKTPLPGGTCRDRLRDLLDGSLYCAAAHQFDDNLEGAITDAAQVWRGEWPRRQPPMQRIEEHAVLITVRSEVGAEAKRELATLRAGILG